MTYNNIIHSSNTLVVVHIDNDNNDNTSYDLARIVTRLGAIRRFTTIIAGRDGQFNALFTVFNRLAAAGAFGPRVCGVLNGL